MCGMRTMVKRATYDSDLAQRADRKLRRYGIDLNRVLSVIVTVRGNPQPFLNLSPVEESLAESADIVAGVRPGNFRPVSQFLADMHALCEQ